MLQNAHSVRIRCIVILAKEIALDVCFVELSQILLEDSHFNEFLHILRQIWQRYEGFIQEPHLCWGTLLLIVFVYCGRWYLHRLIIPSTQII
jgi:hypothetical protein